MFGSQDFPTLKLISAVNCNEFAMMRNAIERERERERSIAQSYV